MKLSNWVICIASGAALVLLWLFGVRSIRTTTPSPATGVKLAPAAPLVSTNLQTFFVRGVVKEVKPDGKTVIVDHEEIPNYMVKMTMPFKVKDPNQLANLGTNDAIHFRLNVDEYESWIDQVTKTGKAASPFADPSRKSFRLVRDVDVLKEGDVLPHYPLTNHLGKAFNTAQFKGQPLAITFIFTRCPIPDFCPRMDFRFTEVTKLIKAMPVGPTNYQLISLSFDVEYDTPVVLQNHASRVKAQHGADMSQWSFATGALIDVDDLTERFGMTFSREPGTIAFNHNLRTVVVDAAGKVQKIFVGNEWKAEALVAELVKAATAKP